MNDVKIVSFHWEEPFEFTILEIQKFQETSL